MGIQIGNNNKIKNTKIIQNEVVVNGAKLKKWHEKHSILKGVIISLISGVVLMLSGWNDIVNFIENLFRG